jgi:hypothetical protein
MIKILIQLANDYEDGKEMDNALTWLLSEVVEQTGFAPLLLALRDVAIEMAVEEDDEAREAALNQLTGVLARAAKPTGLLKMYDKWNKGGLLHPEDDN